MSYTMYTPLNVWLDPASITDVVAYIQNYLSNNPIYSTAEIETLIHDYLIAHPELIGGVTSVNGKTGIVVLSASDINTENNVTIESVLSALGSQISTIAANVATNTANITSLTGRVTTAETDLTNLKSSVTFNKNWLTKDLFSNDGDIELMDVVSSNPTATNQRSVVLNRNIIKKRVTSTNPTGTTTYSFVISNTPRYVGGTATSANSIQSNLQQTDFSKIDLDAKNNLYLTLNCRTNKLVAGGSSSTGSMVFIGTYNNGTIDWAEIPAFPTTLETDMYECVTYDLTNLVPQIRINQNIVIVFEARYPNVEEDFTFEIYEKQFDDTVNGALETILVSAPTFEQGTISLSNGGKVTSTTRIRSTVAVRASDLFKNGLCTISVADGFGANISCYSTDEISSNSYIGVLSSSFMNGTITFKPTIDIHNPSTGEDYYFFFTLRRNDNSTISPSDVDSDTLRFVSRKRPLSGKIRDNTYGSFRRIRFYVNVDNSNYSDAENKTQIRCVLQLPSSYSATGNPTPLIMVGHGSSAHITDSSWGSTNFNTMVDQFCANGYALFDVDNTLDSSDTPVPDAGCSALMQAYLSAWDYIKNHYNVTDDISILSNSMGTYAALNMLKWYGSHVRTAILAAPRVSIGEYYNRSSTPSDKKTHIASVFGWPSSVTSYNAATEYMLGWDDYPEVYTENNVLKIDRKFPPIKVFVGTTDTNGLTEVREYFAALKNSGNVVDYSETDTSSQADPHTFMCYLMSTALMNDGIRWMNRFFSKDNSSLV